MKVIWRPSVDRLSASSDLELKLVTRSLVGTAMVRSGNPSGVTSSKNIAEVIPKLGSYKTSFQTSGYVPSKGAPDGAEQPPVVAAQFGGSTSPTFTFAALLL